MHKPRIFILFIVLLPGLLHAQYFERVYGGNVNVDGDFFTITPDHGIFMAGNSRDSTFNTSAYYLLKVDSNGNKLWTKSYADAFNAHTSAIVALGDSEVVLLGTHEGVSSQNSAEVIVYDATGNETGSRMYPPFNGWGTFGTGIIPVGDTTVTFSLYTDGFISNNFYALYGLKPDLSTAWNDFLGFDGSYTNAHGIAGRDAFGVYSLAYYDMYLFTPTILNRASSLKRHNLVGDLVLDSLYEFDCVTTGIDATTDGGVVVYGTQDNSFPRDLVIIRLDSSGNVLWQRQYGSSSDEESVSILQTHDQGFVMLSIIEDPVLPGQHDLLLMKVNSNGDSLWSRTFGGAFNETGLNLEADGTDLVLMGTTNSFGNDRIYLARLDSSGLFEVPYSLQAIGRYHCQGDTVPVQIVPTPAPGKKIIWSTGDTTQTISVTQSGNYFARIIDAPGDTAQTSFLSFYFAAQPVASLGADTVSLCQGSMINNAGVTDITFSYQWYLNHVALPGEVGSDLTPQQAGTYELVISNYCSSDTAGTYVDSVFSLPAQPVVTAPQVGFVCVGDSLRLSAATGTLSYQWFTTDFYNLTIIPGAIDTVYYALTGGFYVMEGTDVNGCKSYSLPYFVQFDRARVFISLNGPAVFCQGGQVGLSVGPGTDFHWSTGDTTASVLAKTSNDYFVSFTNSYGCVKNSDTVHISVLDNPMVSLGPDTSVCDSQSVILTVDSGYTNYLWSNGSTLRSIAASSAGPYPAIVNYTITISDSSGCTSRDTIQITFDLCSGLGEIDDRQWAIYPNPAGRFGTISLVGALGENLLIEIYDMKNRLVVRKSLNVSDYLELPGLQPGIYHCQILLEGVKRKSQLIFVH